MIKEAINRILELAPPTITTINDSVYSDKTLMRIDESLRADRISMSSLSSLVDYVKSTTDFMRDVQYIIQVESPTKVRLISSLDDDRKRETLAEVDADIPAFDFGRFMGNEEFIIGVQSKFLDMGADEQGRINDKSIILQFAGNVKSGTVAEYGDSGVGQKATIKKGVSSLQEVEVPSPCFLIPFRTFMEVSQPIGSFIFRVRDDDGIGVKFALFEADGGAWKNEAKANIKKYLEEQLKDVGNVMVIA